MISSFVSKDKRTGQHRRVAPPPPQQIRSSGSISMVVGVAGWQRVPSSTVLSVLIGRRIVSRVQVSAYKARTLFRVNGRSLSSLPQHLVGRSHRCSPGRRPNRKSWPVGRSERIATNSLKTYGKHRPRSIHTPYRSLISFFTCSNTTVLRRTQAENSFVLATLRTIVSVTFIKCKDIS